MNKCGVNVLDIPLIVFSFAWRLLCTPSCRAGSAMDDAFPIEAGFASITW
jgi:hypothetical protein